MAEGSRTAAAAEYLEALTADLDVPTSFRDLLTAHANAATSGANAGLAALTFPDLVHSAAHGGDAPAALAALCLAVYLGADLLDNVIDSELTPPWDGRTDEATLAGSGLLSIVPQLAITQLRRDGASEHTCWDITRQLADALAEMAAGQHEELLLSRSRDVDPGRAREAAERKAGGEFGFFGGAAAAVAGADGERVDRYRDVGRCLGTALQIRSDLRSVVMEEPSDDLRNARRTLPIAFTLARLEGPKRARFHALLARAATDVDAAADVRRELLATGAVRHGALVIEIYLERARRALEAAQPADEPGRELRRLIDEVSLIPR